MVNFFEFKRGLRQGDPILPFLFLIAMEYLSCLLDRLDKKAGKSKGGFLVSWKEVCKEKDEGGLGIKDLSVMNKAMRLNQLWEMSKDAYSVWRAWTRAYWTKGKDWWEAENASDGFKIRDTYDTLVAAHSEKMEWHKLVWNGVNSPKSAFHLWLVAKNKVLTMDRMRDMGYTGEGSCVLCRSAQGSRDHLFFDCQFAKQTIQLSAGFFKMRGIPTVWHLLIPWFKSLNSNALRTRMLAAVKSMSAYEIWRARNSYIFRGEVPSIPSAMKRII
ncbi:hypothetical protein QQ045_010353 [Rhodiola kirilowii]